MSSEARESRTQALQDRLLRVPDLEAHSKEELLRQVRGYLRLAINDEVLTNAPDEPFRLVKLDPARNKEEFLIVGGDKNEARDVNLSCFRRADGGWFHFALTGRQKSRTAIELLGYNFDTLVPGAVCALDPRWRPSTWAASPAPGRDASGSAGAGSDCVPPPEIRAAAGEALLSVLTARGLALSDALRAQILSCQDLATLDRWLARALTAQTATDVLSAA